MNIINKLYAIIAAFFVVVLGAFSIHARAKKQGKEQEKKESVQAVQQQAAEARVVVKAAKEKTESKSDAEIKQVAKSKYVRGSGSENK